MVVKRSWYSLNYQYRNPSQVRVFPSVVLSTKNSDLYILQDFILWTKKTAALPWFPSELAGVINIV